VAEQFGTLVALHPGRIDLGLGRAAGADHLTTVAVRGGAEPPPDDDFPRQLAELLGFFNGTFSDGHPYREITATPGLGYQPALWLLGSSTYSADVAGWLGLPFSFAHHFSPANTLPALARYRASFRPSATLSEPYAMVAVSVIVGDDDDHAVWLSGPSRLSFVRRRTGRAARLASPEEAAGYRYSPREFELLRTWATSSVVGGPERVRAELLDLTTRTGASELMVLTSVHGQADRLASYERLLAASP
jgi:luciferase family oxidoreductase group 1